MKRSIGTLVRLGVLALAISRYPAVVEAQACPNGGCLWPLTPGFEFCQINNTLQCYQMGPGNGQVWGCTEGSWWLHSTVTQCTG